jgi:hypothetical protein
MIGQTNRGWQFGIEGRAFASDSTEANVSGKSHYRRVRSLRLGQPRNKRVAKVVEAARYVSCLACALPGHFPAVHRLRRDYFVGALFAVVSGETVLFMREYMVFTRTMLD